MNSFLTNNKGDILKAACLVVVALGIYFFPNQPKPPTIIKSPPAQWHTYNPNTTDPVLKDLYYKVASDHASLNSKHWQFYTSEIDFKNDTKGTLAVKAVDSNGNCSLQAVEYSVVNHKFIKTSQVYSYSEKADEKRT